MKISVIIPVYNAAKFLTQAVDSALMQPETGEVILVEDGSEDDSLAICRELADKENRVRLFQHLGGANKGAGASRNLGIQMAQYDWIAFLDADDYFLEGRFKRALNFIQQNGYVDAVAEAIGAKFQDTEGRDRYLESRNLPINTDEKKIVTGLSSSVSNKNVFETLFLGHSGHLSLIGLVVRKSVFERIGLFNDYIITQDSNFLFRLAYYCEVKVFDKSQIVAIRRIHKNNRWNASKLKRLEYISLNIQDVVKMINPNTISKDVAIKLASQFVRSWNPIYFKSNNKIKKMAIISVGFFLLLVKHPTLFFKSIGQIR